MRVETKINLAKLGMVVGVLLVGSSLLRVTGRSFWISIVGYLLVVFSAVVYLRLKGEN